MSRRRLIAFPVLLLLVAVFVAFLVFNAGNDDSDLVICLSPQRKSELVAAAVALKLGKPVRDAPDMLEVDGQSQAVEAWRDNQPEQFDRACAALADALARTGDA